MKKVWITIAIILAVGQCMSPDARAQAPSGEPMTVEKTVVTATMTPKEINDAPGSIEVITSVEIKAMGAETVAEQKVTTAFFPVSESEENCQLGRGHGAMGRMA